MSLYDPTAHLPKEVRDKLPPAFNGCCCSCHTTPGLIHCVPCCSPGRGYETVDGEPCDGNGRIFPNVP